MKFIKARSAGFAERDYDMTASDGPKGTSRKVVLADGDELDKVKVSEDLWATFSKSERAVFETLGSENFGAIVSATFNGGDGVKGFGITGLRIETHDGTVLLDRLTERGSLVFGSLV